MPLAVGTEARLDAAAAESFEIEHLPFSLLGAAIGEASAKGAGETQTDVGGGAEHQGEAGGAIVVFILVLIFILIVAGGEVEFGLFVSFLFIDVRDYSCRGANLRNVILILVG